MLKKYPKTSVSCYRDLLAKQIKTSTASKELVHLILVNPKEESGMQIVNTLPCHSASSNLSEESQPLKSPFWKSCSEKENSGYNLTFSNPRL